MTAPWTLHWLEAEGAPRCWQAVVETEIAAAQQAIARIVPLHPIDILIQAVPRWGIPGQGLNGFSHRAGLMTLTLDSDSPDRERTLAEGLLRRIVAHEVHHCMRYAAGQGARPTLGAAMVGEGLADHFVVEVFGPPACPWTAAFDAEEWTRIRAAAPTARDDPAVNQAHWLFARGDRGLPRWAGYRLGFALVGAHLAANPGARASALAGTPPDPILADAWPTLFPAAE